MEVAVGQRASELSRSTMASVIASVGDPEHRAEVAALAKSIGMDDLVPANWDAGTDAPATSADIERKAVSGFTGVIDSDDESGVVTAIVSVTGIFDEVGDLIEPGAYAEPLSKRTPKGVWSHDWNTWVSRTEEAVELMPGDPRLPKKTKDGRPWPKEAGALRVRTRFNLETQPGREAYSNVKFFGDECEWSIGYRVGAGHSRRDSLGRRIIKVVTELFEYSPVLFGAMSLCATIPTKTREMKQALQTKETPVGSETTDADLHAADDIDWSSADAAGAVYDADGDLDTAALDGLWEEPATKALLASDPEGKAEGGADRNRGNAEELRRWYVNGEGAVKIRWGTEGDFMRCVRIAGKHMTATRAKGYCALRHRDATGEWPGKGAHSGKKDGEPADSETKTVHLPDLAGSLERRVHAVQEALAEKYRRRSAEGKRERWFEVVNTFADYVLIKVTEWTPADAGMDATRREFHMRVAYTIGADGAATLGEETEVEITPTVSVKALTPSAVVVDDDGTVRVSPAGDTEGKALETTVKGAYPYLSGSMEERRELVRVAVDHMMRGNIDEDGRPEYWVYVHSTFDDSVIVHREKLGSGATDTTYWRIPYAIAEDGSVELGEPSAVELNVTVEVTDTAADPGGTYTETAAKALRDAFDGLTEAKAGRVLSRDNESRLVAAVKHLVEVLRRAGVDVVIEPAKIDAPADSTDQALAERSGASADAGTKATLDPNELVQAMEFLRG